MRAALASGPARPFGATSGGAEPSGAGGLRPGLLVLERLPQLAELLLQLRSEASAGALRPGATLGELAPGDRPLALELPVEPLLERPHRALEVLEGPLHVLAITLPAWGRLGRGCRGHTPEPERDRQGHDQTLHRPP